MITDPALLAPTPRINWSDVLWSAIGSFVIVFCAVLWLSWRPLPGLVVPQGSPWLHLRALLAVWFLPATQTAQDYKYYLGQIAFIGESNTIMIRFLFSTVAAVGAAMFAYRVTAVKRDNRIIKSDQKIIISEKEAAASISSKVKILLKLGAVPIPLKLFLKSVVIFGATGSGKTQTIWAILRQLISGRDYKLLILDGPKGDFSQSVDPVANPVIIAPWHNGNVYQPSADITERAHGIEFFNKMVPEGQGDPMWANAARGIGVANMCKLISDKPGEWTWGDLCRELYSPIENQKENARKYFPPALESLRDIESKTTQSVLINLHAFLIPLFEIAVAWGDKPGTFAFKKWWAADAADVDKKVVILQLHAVYGSTSVAFASAVIGLLAQYTKSPEIGESSTRNNLMVLDEFYQLPKLDDFSALIDLGRSKSCSVLVATQSPGQLLELYGENILNSWYSSLGLRIYGQIKGKGDLEFVEQNLGKAEHFDKVASVAQPVGGGNPTVTTSYTDGDAFIVKRPELERLGADEDAGIFRLIVDGLRNPFRLSIPYVHPVKFRESYIKNPDFGRLNFDELFNPVNTALPDGANGAEQSAEPDPAMVQIEGVEGANSGEAMVQNPEEPHQTTDLAIPDFMNPVFAGFGDGANLPAPRAEPESDGSPFDDAIGHVASDQAVEVVEHLAGVDGLGLVLEIIEAVEGVQKHGANSRKEATRAKLQSAVAALKERGEKPTQAAVATEARVSLRTAKNFWNEIEPQ